MYLTKERIDEILTEFNTAQIGTQEEADKELSETDTIMAHVMVKRAVALTMIDILANPKQILICIKALCTVMSKFGLIVGRADAVEEAMQKVSIQ